jgi:hypothetical protein
LNIAELVETEAKNVREIQILGNGRNIGVKKTGLNKSMKAEGGIWKLEVMNSLYLKD